MMGRYIKMAAVAFTAIITLTGCGTKLYDMTDAEQGLIANYSAYVVAKHNIYQQDGMTDATENRGDMEDAEDTEKVDEESPDNSPSQDIRHLKPEMIRVAIRRKSLLPHRKRRCHLPRQQATAALKLHMME